MALAVSENFEEQNRRCMSVSLHSQCSICINLKWYYMISFVSNGNGP